MVLRRYSGNQGAVIDWPCGNAITNNKWVAVAAVHGEGVTNAKMYYDGVEQSVTTTAPYLGGPLYEYRNTMTIGNRASD